MKKRSLIIITLTISLCMPAILGGCADNILAEQRTTEQAYDSGNTFSKNSISMAEACENDEVISTEEQAKSEEARRDEIAEQYSIYEPYGMTYDKEKDRFFYNGQIVRCEQTRHGRNVRIRRELVQIRIHDGSQESIGRFAKSALEMDSTKILPGWGL